MDRSYTPTGVGGNDVPKKHTTNTNGIEGLMPAELAN
jgi:hypothetical protein